MQRVLDIAFRAADTTATVLIVGPSGTGKNVLAREIHRRSAQRDRPFVTVNCPSLSRELLESELFGHVQGAFTGAVQDTFGKVAAAEGGTLFLDEIGEMPLEIQPKLLRLLQDREYERVGEARPRKAEVRVMAASNRDLAEEMKAGRFREDLFFRLNVITLALPGLRERPADLIRLAENDLALLRPLSGQEGAGPGPGGGRGVPRLRVAGQSARIAQCDRTGRHPGRRRHPRAGRSAGGVLAPARVPGPGGRPRDPRRVGGRASPARPRRWRALWTRPPARWASIRPRSTASGRNSGCSEAGASLRPRPRAVPGPEFRVSRSARICCSFREHAAHATLPRAAAAPAAAHRHGRIRAFHLPGIEPCGRGHAGGQLRGAGGHRGDEGRGHADQRGVVSGPARRFPRRPAAGGGAARPLCPQPARADHDGGGHAARPAGRGGGPGFLRAGGAGRGPAAPAERGP